ncbi:PRC-barrel domain-containing protein [Thalassococcus sp. S3]|uniref:PRC-barrel domain-containing protein n=1 Tax=Thalassococcus sp. S3 TaxID=2017482 RepID=UPI00102438AF|nr:PRC-barrel domain-containing protein [Thalassococcus sp. S3]QBF34003.1 photosystem reaction center subunit H [Thalassococcus sp. S3]
MKLMTTTAVAIALAATSAFAGNMTTKTETEAAKAAESASYEMDTAELIRSRDITGGTVYTTNANDNSWDSWSMAPMHDAVSDEWSQIGQIEDIVLSKKGQMIGIVAEVGGFLDIGDKHVMIPVEDVNLVAVDDQSYAFVTRLSEEQLESMEGVDEGFWN